MLAHPAATRQWLSNAAQSTVPADVPADVLRLGVHWVCPVGSPADPSSPSAPAARLVLVAPDEWAKGTVRVKDLASREEADVPLDQLV